MKNREKNKIDRVEDYVGNLVETVGEEGDSLIYK